MKYFSYMTEPEAKRVGSMNLIWFGFSEVFEEVGAENKLVERCEYCLLIARIVSIYKSNKSCVLLSLHPEQW